MEVTTGQLNGRAPISHALCMSLAQLTLFSCSHAFDFIYFEQRTSRAYKQKKYVSVTILVAEISYPCIILNMQLPSGIDQESQQEIVFDNMASTNGEC